MISALGNPPANPPTYQCVKVFDATGKVMVAEGTRSGITENFEFRCQLARTSSKRAA